MHSIKYTSLTYMIQLRYLHLNNLHRPKLLGGVVLSTKAFAKSSPHMGLRQLSAKGMDMCHVAGYLDLHVDMSYTSALEC